MKKITFRYADAMSNWEWRTQSCVVTDIRECVRIYGLNEPDVEWELVSVEDDIKGGA